MNNKIPTEDELLAKLVELENNLKLTDLERETITSNKAYLWRDFEEKKHALHLHHLGSILSAQIEKAERGDTSAAKFLVDLVAPEAYDDNDADTTPALWEEAAIAIRDKLGLPISAEVLVLTLLQKLPLNTIAETLNPKSVS
jgi:hypothetical protein